MSTVAQNLPPTLPDTSPVANGIALTRDPLGFFVRLAREAGNFAHYELTDRIVYFVNDHKLAREVLVVHEDDFEKWAFNDSFNLVFGDGLIGSHGDLHRKMRRIAQPPLQKERFARYATTIVDVTEERQRTWSAGEIDLSREMTLLTVDVIGRALFSTSLGKRADKIFEATRTLMLLSTRLGGAAEEVQGFHAANATISEIAQQLVDEFDRSQNDGSLLAHLLSARDRGEPGMSDHQLREELRTFILAGHVTTAQTLACALWLLARDEASQKKLQEEVDTVLAGRVPRAEDLPQLVFCEAIILEALRLYPPVWVFGREALTEVQLNGYPIKTGEELVVCAWLLHRNPEIFPEPESFKPDRWLGDARAKLPRCSYLPFSSGPRSCLGEHFALMESVLVLASIAQHWQFRELPDRPDPGWSPQLLYWPRRGIRLRAEQRAAQ